MVHVCHDVCFLLELHKLFGFFQCVCTCFDLKSKQNGMSAFFGRRWRLATGAGGQEKERSTRGVGIKKCVATYLEFLYCYKIALVRTLIYNTKATLTQRFQDFLKGTAR